MKRQRISGVIYCAIIAAGIAGCGGGSGTGVTTQPPVTAPPTGGISGNGVAIGPVSTFGSIVVNGVRYETDSATFTINDAAGTQADLKVGYIVTVSGTIDSDETPVRRVQSILTIPSKVRLRVLAWHLASSWYSGKLYSLVRTRRLMMASTRPHSTASAFRK